MGGARRRDELASHQVPVLFACGDRDFVPVAAGQQIARPMPSATFEAVTDAGHLLWIGKPAEAAH